MDEISISSLCEYIDLLGDVKRNYSSYAFQNNPVSPTFLFRGVCCINYPLLPSIFRKNTTIVDSKEIENSCYTVWGTEKQIIKIFQSEASAYIKDLSTESLCRCAEYAQHYGVPTRFLDWTTNPLVALYFSCKNSPSDNAAVWMLHRENYRRFVSEITKENLTEESKKQLTIEETINSLILGEQTVDYPIIYTPYYVDHRMSAQSSFFMAWGWNQEPLERLIPEERYMVYNRDKSGVRLYGNDQASHILMKLQIPCSCKQLLLRELDVVGINEKTLFPGLDGIGRYVERKYRFD